MIDGGEHLWRCLKYIDLNMVRAGKVEHPSDWPWCGYRELVGKKRRDRLVDRKELLRALGDGYAEESVGMNYQEGIEETLSLQNAAREPLWTESLAVGRRNFVEETGRNIRNRMRVTVETTGDRNSTWVAREDRTSYG